jgi:hypothetical protein
MINYVLLPIISCLFLVGAIRFGFKAWKRNQNEIDEVKRTRGKLEFQRNLSWSLLLLSFGNMLDAQVYFPFPLVGRASMTLSLLTGLVGGFYWVKHYMRPKTEEALMLSEKTDGFLTLAIMMRKLGLSQYVAEKTLSRMLRDQMVTIRNPSKKMVAQIVFFVSNNDASVFRRDEEPDQSFQEPEEVDVDEINERFI